jgi:hypothetical protein
MSTAEPRAPFSHEYPTFGLPPGTIRGFLSVLICSFFWIVLLYPGDRDVHVPLGHFFLLALVFFAFASHPLQGARTHPLPWAMRVIFVGGSLAAFGLAMWKDTHVASARLTPNATDITQFPVLLICFAAGFGVSLILRFVLGRDNPMFMTLRAWVGVIAVLLLLAETLIQFAILPGITDQNQRALEVWEGVITATVAAYFGSRA